MGRLFALAAAAGFLLALFGPFGTYQSMPLADRLIFWELVLLCAAALHVPALWLADRFGQIAGVPPVLWVAGAGFVAAAPTTLIVTGIMATLYGLSEAPNFGAMYFYVVSISVPMQILSYAVLRGLPAKAAEARPVGDLTHVQHPPSASVDVDPPAAPTAVPTPKIPLLADVPPQLGRELQCLEMQDHYVRVHTLKGSVLLLRRMRDAERELGDLEGERVHRSWWVARSAVVGVRPRGQSIALDLANGLSVPVSRTKLATIRKAGWLDDVAERSRSAAEKRFQEGAYALVGDPAADTE